MHRQRNSLSANDQKAIDALLDHSAATTNGQLTRHAPAVSPKSLKAATQLLEILAELPAMDPPTDLVARTMQRIDQQIAGHVGKRREQAASMTARLHH